MLAVLVVLTVGVAAPPAEPLAGHPACSTSSNATAAVHGLIRRMLPSHVAAQFTVEHCPLDASSDLVDFFEVLPATAQASGVHIRGSSGVASKYTHSHNLISRGVLLRDLSKNH